MYSVTVLTAAYNAEKYISETIDSILSQTYTDFEYIIIDDNSTDNTVKIINDYLIMDHRIKLIQLDKNIGPYGAANVGLKKAEGRYIIRTDADDISLPNRIELQINFLKSNPKIRACGSWAMRIDENSKKLKNQIIKSTTSSASLKWQLFLHCPLVHSSACIDKEIFEEMGWYNSSYAAQDYRMWCYLANRELLAQIPEVLVYFRKSPNGISFSERGIQKEFHYKVSQDHIYNVTGEKWSIETIKSLNAIGLVEKGYPVSKAIKASRLWDQHWIRDKSLSNEEVQELFYLSTYLRKTFLRRNRRRQFMSVLLNINSYYFPQPAFKTNPRVPNILPY